MFEEFPGYLAACSTPTQPGRYFTIPQSTSKFFQYLTYLTQSSLSKVIVITDYQSRLPTHSLNQPIKDE